MRRVAVVLLVASAVALIGGAGYFFIEFLAADDAWERLAIVPAVVAFVLGALLALGAYLVWRDSTQGWIGAAVVTVVAGVTWMDFGAGTSGPDILILVVPWLIIGAMLVLTITRLTRSGSSEGR